MNMRAAFVGHNAVAQWARRPAKTAKSQLWNFKIIKWLL